MARQRRNAMSTEGFVFAMVLLAGSGCSSTGRDGGSLLITSEQVRRLEPVDQQDVDFGSLRMVGGEELEIGFQLTTKGNGGLDIGNLSLRVYDAHGDGLTYSPHLLSVRAEKNSKGECIVLRLDGTGVQTEEQGDKEIGRIPIHLVCKYDPRTHKFDVEGEGADHVVIHK